MSDRDITLREFVEHGIEHMEVLRVQPGDVCVIRSEKDLSDQAVSLINEAWRRMFPERDAPKLIVLDRSMTLGVLRPLEDAAPTSEAER